MNVPWSKLRQNPRDGREKAAAEYDERDEPARLKEGERKVTWDVTDFGRRMAFGGIVSAALDLLIATILAWHFLW